MAVPHWGTEPTLMMEYPPVVSKKSAKKATRKAIVQGTASRKRIEDMHKGKKPPGSTISKKGLIKEAAKKNKWRTETIKAHKIKTISSGGTIAAGQRIVPPGEGLGRTENKAARPKTLTSAEKAARRKNSRGPKQPKTKTKKH